MTARAAAHPMTAVPDAGATPAGVRDGRRDPGSALPRSPLWCAVCGEDALAGGPLSGLVVHAVTGEVYGPDGHVADPTADRQAADAAARTARTALQAGYPGWRIWRSDLGRWWASRLGARAPQPLSLDADTAAGLRAALEADAGRQRARA